MPLSIPYFLRDPDKPIQNPIVTADGFELHPARYFQGDRLGGKQGWAFFPESVAFDVEQYGFMEDKFYREYARAGIGDGLDAYTMKIPYLIPEPHRPPGVWHSSGTTDWHYVEKPLHEIVFYYHVDLQRLPWKDRGRTGQYRFGRHNVESGRYPAAMYPGWSQAEIENDQWWLEYRHRTGNEYMNAIFTALYESLIYPACAKAGIHYNDLAHARVKIVKGVATNV
jgi:hypothetical protein